jgi:TrmH family RNA methyltransferase
MGSFLRVAVRYDALAVALAALGRPVYAATLDGAPVTGIAASPPGVILVGNESHGLSSGLLALATLQVTIPRIGAAESLNAAVATGILLSHFTRNGSPSRV